MHLFTDEEMAHLEELQAAQTSFDSRIYQMKQWFVSSIAASAENQPGGIVSMRFTVRSSDNPNVRSEPAASGRIIGHASASAEYEVLDVSPGLWFRIRLENGKTGWISSKLGTITELVFPFETE